MPHSTDFGIHSTHRKKQRRPLHKIASTYTVFIVEGKGLLDKQQGKERKESEQCVSSFGTMA
jgi:hypothetical protein